MRLRQRITSLVLTAVTILTMIVAPMTPAYASGGVGDGLGNTSATGGSSSGTWAASRTGIRVYVVDETGALMSNIVDIVSNTTFPSYDVVACFGTRGIGTHQYYLKSNFGIGAYSSTANIVGGNYINVLILSDSSVGLDDLLPIQTYSDSAGKFTTHGETLRKAMLGSGGEGDVWNPGTSLQGGGGGSATTDNTVDLGNEIATLKESIENLFNALKAAGNTNEQIRAELGLEIISIMSDLDSSVDDSGNQIFTEAEKKVIVAALEAHRDSLLNLSGSETELQDNSLKALQSSSLFDIAYAAEDDGMAKLYNNGRLIDLMEKHIGEAPLFRFNDASGITDLSVLPNTGEKSFLKTCADHGFIIFMEPLFYNRLNKLNKEASAYVFYGTVSNYGQFINEQAANGGWSNGNDVGGNLDKALHQSLAWSMYTDHKLDTGKGINIEAGSDHPALNKKLTNGYLANSKWWGFALHYGMCCLMATTANNKAKEEMLEHLSKMEVTPETFKDCKKHREDKTLDRIQIAAMNYFLCQTSYNASTDSFKKNLDIAAYQSGLQRLREMQAPMEGILVTNDDYRTLFNKYGKDTKVLKYLDPPYHPCTRATAEVYNHEMTQAQHKELVELLCNSRCWILSGLDPMKYGCDDYKALEDDGAEKVSLGVYHLPSSNKTGQKSLTYKEEFLWIRA